MEGMIWNANHVLESALSPKTNGIPRGLVKKCKGVLLISVHEAGIIFSGNTGTGIIMAQGDDGAWSAPSAVGMSGIGFGFLINYSVKDIVILIMGSDLLREAAAGQQFKLSGQLQDAHKPIGPKDSNRMEDYNTFNEGDSGAFGFLFSDTIFSTFAIEAALFKPRPKENAKFYGKDVSPEQIMFENAVTIPEGTLIPEIHRKLDVLKTGKTSEPSVEDIATSEKFRVDADAAAEEAKAEQDDVMHIDAKEEAAKEVKSKEADNDVERTR